MHRMMVGLMIALMIGMGSAGYGADSAVAAGAQDVGWQNRSVSFGNYLPFAPVDLAALRAKCPGDCTYCNKDKVCCKTGCKCEKCKYICDDCANCPAAVFDKIYFDLDKAVLRPQGIVECEAIVALMNSRAELVAIIEGHTCDLASDAYNMTLGQRRADAVAQYLVEHGVNSSRVSTVSLGETQPAAGVDHRELNRRAVVITLVPAK
ncbi:MAG TPA: OmpA family protein [Candidatus Hydrogenedentes bacterium]|nr:OmpA family protein [Candidatus Hydrogenedentota bacterium]